MWHEDSHSNGRRKPPGFAFFDAETGKYINESWTPAEASVFNDFKREDDGITIHNAEAIPPFLGLALILFLSKAKIVELFIDNQNVVQNLFSYKAMNANCHECLVLLCLTATLWGKSVWQSYVASKDNELTDAMTRSDYHDKMQRLLAEWEVRTGRKVDQIAIPAKLRDITHLVANQGRAPSQGTHKCYVEQASWPHGLVHFRGSHGHLCAAQHFQEVHRRLSQ